MDTVWLRKTLTKSAGSSGARAPCRVAARGHQPTAPCQEVTPWVTRLLLLRAQRCGRLPAARRGPTAPDRRLAGTHPGPEAAPEDANNSSLTFRPDPLRSPPCCSGAESIWGRGACHRVPPEGQQWEVASRQAGLEDLRDLSLSFQQRRRHAALGLTRSKRRGAGGDAGEGK